MGGAMMLWFSALEARNTWFFFVAFILSCTGLAVLLSAIYEPRRPRDQKTYRPWPTALISTAISVVSHGILLAVFSPAMLQDAVRIVAIAFVVSSVAAALLDGSERWLLYRPLDD
jgi:cell division protein FtsW (lipid II flippase)